MNTNRHILFLTFTILFISSVHSQKGLNWMRLWERSILDSTMNISYNNTENIIPDSSSLNLPSQMDVSRRNHLISTDGNFMVFFDIMPPFTRSDSIKFTKMDVHKLHNWDKVNKEHILKAEAIISKYYGSENRDNWRNHTSYLANDEAKANFNADTAIYISLPRKDNYFDSYNYYSVLIIQKQDRGCLPMHLFYNENGKEKLNEYLSIMGNTFKYEDAPPLKEKIDNNEIMIVSPPMQKKEKIIR